MKSLARFEILASSLDTLLRLDTDTAAAALRHARTYAAEGMLVFVRDRTAPKQYLDESELVRLSKQEIDDS